MTEVLVPVLVPYARFLEVRARRLDIITELSHQALEHPINVAISPTPAANDEPAVAAVRVLATAPVTGVQP